MRVDPLEILTYPRERIDNDAAATLDWNPPQIP
jgi:hypothetical protein